MLDQWLRCVRKEVVALIEEPTVIRLFLEACANGKEALGAGANWALTTALPSRFNLPAMRRT